MISLKANKYLNSAYLLYFCFLAMIFIALSMKDTHFEAPEVGAITQILHPEYPKGPLQYHPSFNYDYIIAFVAQKLGFKDNFTQLSPLFWFIDVALAVFVLIKLCNLIFKNDKLVLTIAVMLFIFLKSGEIDQKTMLAPIYLAAVYFFLKERWYISASFAAAIFYIHFGFALWWFLPSCFAILMLLLRGRVSLKHAAAYAALTIVFSLPVLSFYLNRHSKLDELFVKYYYFTSWNSTSVLMNLVYPKLLASIILPFLLAIVGYIKARKEGYRNDFIMPVITGVLILFLIDFIGADLMGNGSFITLQLLRSVVNVELFSGLFFAFLLARQIVKGNFVFLFLFIIVSRYYYSGLSRFFGNISYYGAQNILYSAVVFYEIIEKYTVPAMTRAYDFLSAKINAVYLKKIAGKSKRLMQYPVFIAISFIVLTGPKSVMKFFLKAPQQNKAVEWTQDRYLYDDIAKFTNENIKDRNALLLTPFLRTDFQFYTGHHTFINFASPLFELVSLEEDSRPEFKTILKEDLNLPLEDFLSVKNFDLDKLTKSWDEKWRDLDEETIRKWHKKYHLTHVVRENELAVNFPSIYKNKFYTVYEIN